MSAAFIDSGAFIAFLSRRDRQHRTSVEMFSTPPRRWVTSVLVVAECYSWFLHRHGESVARSFADLVRSLPGLEILPADADHLADVWRQIDRLRGVKLTAVDASILVWLRKLRISVVWGTDSHLASEGARVIPGPPA